MQSKTDIEGGKYTIVHDNGTDLHILRNGEMWLDHWPLPEKMLIAAAAEIDQLRAALAKAEAAADAATDTLQELASRR